MMTCLSSPQAHWRPKHFFFLQLASMLLLGSWLLPSTRAFWTALDIPVYRALNGSLGHWYGWDLLWAFLSTRIADLCAAAVMLCALIYRDLIFAQAQLRRALVTFFVLLLVMLVVRVLFTKFITAQGLQHASPSVHLGGGFQLSAAFSWMEQFFEIKDRSSRSFPGDHASVLLLWVVFLSVFSKGKQRVLVCLTGLFFILPRLIAGAHWLSDNLVGGGFVVLQTLAWGYCSIFGDKLYQLLEKLSNPVFRALQYLPLINRFAIVRQVKG